MGKEYEVDKGMDLPDDNQDSAPAYNNDKNAEVKLEGYKTVFNIKVALTPVELVPVKV
jgi:hypothetical protein